LRRRSCLRAAIKYLVQNQDLDLLSAGQMGDDAGDGARSGRGRADFRKRHPETSGGRPSSVAMGLAQY
jgi:hypothetical protein